MKAVAGSAIYGSRGGAGLLCSTMSGQSTISRFLPSQHTDATEELEAAGEVTMTRTRAS